MSEEKRNYKICYRLKEDFQDPNRPESWGVQESANFFTKPVAEELSKRANKNFTRAEHWVERRK